MTRDELISTLKKDLKVKKEIIAIKAIKQAPSDIPHYQGQASPGMCALVGKILKDGSLWYAHKENLGCFEALTGTGTCENMPKDKYLEFMIEQNQSYPMHRDADILVKTYGTQVYSCTTPYFWLMHIEELIIRLRAAKMAMLTLTAQGVDPERGRRCFLTRATGPLPSTT